MCTSRELLQYFSDRQYKQKTSPKSYKTEIKIFANPKQPGPEKLVMTTNLEKKKANSRQIAVLQTVTELNFVLTNQNSNMTLCVICKFNR